MFLSLMFIVICGHSRRFVAGFAHEFPRRCRFPLLFTMRHLDSAGEFRARGTKNNGGPHISRKRTRFGPGAEIDERARAVADCHPLDYVTEIEAASPMQGLVRLDAGTTMSPGSFEAGLRGGRPRHVGVRAAAAATASLDDFERVSRIAPYPCPPAASGTNRSAIGIGCGMKCCSAMYCTRASSVGRLASMP
jgi:hypothetical protein